MADESEIDEPAAEDLTPGAAAAGDGAPDDASEPDAGGQRLAPDAAADDVAARAAGEASADGEAAPEIPPAELRAILEALVFASPEPLTPRRIGQLLASVPKEDWQAALEALRADYAAAGRGLQLAEVAGGFQVTTRPEYNEWIRELVDPKAPARLSIQALETLAVIAYKQPVTLPEIIELRGVKSGGVLKTLLERHLIRIVGRKEVVGRPILYGTTREFLLHFGMKDLAELPRIEEFADVLGEEVDVAGLKRAIEAPRPLDLPVDEEPDAASPEAEPADADSGGKPDRALPDEEGE